MLKIGLIVYIQGILNKYPELKKNNINEIKNKILKSLWCDINVLKKFINHKCINCNCDLFFLKNKIDIMIGELWNA